MFATFQQRGLLLSCNGNCAGSGFREFGADVVAHVPALAAQDLKQSVYGDASKVLACAVSRGSCRLDLF